MKSDHTLYFHIRPLGYYLGKDNDRTTKIDQWLVDYWSKTGTTFAFERRADGCWYGSYAVTSKADQFCRRLGRLVAKGKLTCKRKDLAFAFGPEEPTFDDCVVLNDLINYEKQYQRLMPFYDNDAGRVADVLSSYPGFEQSIYNAYAMGKPALKLNIAHPKLVNKDTEIYA
jgi:hypothetical protein